MLLLLYWNIFNPFYFYKFVIRTFSSILNLQNSINHFSLVIYKNVYLYVQQNKSKYKLN